jgi:membrane protease YdiL (CAAX protease family)
MKKFMTIQDKSPLSNTKAILILITYFILYFFLIPLAMLWIDDLWIPGFSTNPTNDVIFHTLTTLLFLYLASPLLQESNKHWTKLAFTIPILAGAFMIYGSALLSTLIDTLSGQSDPLNQALLLQQFQINRLSIMVQAMIFAPVVEEIVFRGVIYRQFKKAGRYLIPLIISTLLFSTMHSLAAIISGQWSDLWYIPVYAFMSLVLTFTYEKTHNLYSSMFLHFINNAISILAMLYLVK